MTRITRKSREDLPAAEQPLWDRMLAAGDFADQAGVMAQRLPIFSQTWALLLQLGQEAVLPRRYTELAIVTVSLLNDCEYCIDHHGPKLLVEGLSEQGVQSLLDYASHPELNEVDRLVVEYAIAVTRNWSQTRDEIFARLHQHFSEAQIVELTWRTALCGAFNRFNDILQVQTAPLASPAASETAAQA